MIVMMIIHLIHLRLMYNCLHFSKPLTSDEIKLLFEYKRDNNKCSTRFNLEERYAYMQFDKCAICLQPKEEIKTKHLASTVCDHYFHRKCLREWFRNSKNIDEDDDLYIVQFVDL